MKVLLVTSEAHPFIKTGGLADVAGALPKALLMEDIECSVVLPLYKNIKFREEIKFLKNFEVKVSWRNQYCGVYHAKKDGVNFYFIDNERYFKRDELYGYYDDGERFAFFNKAVLEVINEIDIDIDIIHCNDWQCGMVPFLLKMEYIKKSRYRNIKTIFSIHNLLFQGNFEPKILEELLGYTMEQYNNGNVELYGATSFMKAGINYADKITTVSESYANEIQSVQYGEKLDGLLYSRRHDLTGIVNGIDYDLYNPNTDSMIYKNYDINSIEYKKENKIRLQEELGLDKDANIPMLGMVSRLTSQKGMDIFLDAIDKLLSKNIQIVILGTGYYEYENAIKDIEIYNKAKMKVNIYFSEKMSHLIYAASDMFIMPSLFEPCGLGQIIALRYGSIPIVRETGGLRDTVNPYNKYTGEGNGFSFKNYNGNELFKATEYALKCYENKNIWHWLVKNAMSCDYSWDKSAKKYTDIYRSLKGN